MAKITEKKPAKGEQISFQHVGLIVSPVSAPSAYQLVCKEYENARIDTQGRVHLFLVDLQSGQRWTDTKLQNYNEAGGFYIRDHELLIG